MSDFDRLLKDALQSAGDSHRPESTHSARSKFVAARRRRSLFTAATSLAVLAALVTTVVAAPWDGGNTDIVGPAPGPTAPPGEMLITAATDVDSTPSDIDVDGDRLYVGSAETGKISVVNPGKNDVEVVIDPFEQGREITGEGPTSTVELDVSDGVITTTSGNWLFKATVGPHGGDPEWETPVGSRWSAPISDFVVSNDHVVWVAGPSPFDKGDQPGIFRVEGPHIELAGGGFEVPEPARLDFGYGNLWAAQTIGHDWLTRIDPETLEQTTVPEPGGGRNSIDADLEVSVGAGAVWTHYPAQESLIRVDPATATISGKWPMAGRQAVIEATEDLGVFVMIHRSQEVSRLYRIDPNSGETLGETMDFAGPGPFALESGFGSLWIADQSHNKVYRIEVGEKISTEPEIVESVPVSPHRSIDGSKPHLVKPQKGGSSEDREGRVARLMAKLAQLNEDISRLLASGKSDNNDAVVLLHRLKRAMRQELNRATSD